MTVLQKKDGRWFVRIRDKATGRLKDRYFGRGIESERAAREYNESLNLRAYTRRTPKQQSPYFVELANAYTAAKMGRLPPVSIRNLLYKLSAVIVPTLGETVQAINITPARLDRYVEKRLSAGIKKTTIHRELSDVRAIMNWSVKRGYLTRNPAAGYEMPTRDDHLIMPPTIAELNAILAHAKPHLRRALSLSYYTGLRPGTELYTLTWHDLDCDSQTIRIVSAKKHGAPSRSVPLNPDFVRILIRWYHDDVDAGLPDAAPIVHFNRRPIRSIKTAFAHAKKKAGIFRRLRPYDLRHAFASAILEHGGDLKSTSELLGHSRVSTTVQIYQHTNQTMRKDAVDRLPRLTIHSQPDKKKGPRSKP